VDQQVKHFSFVLVVVRPCVDLTDFELMFNGLKRTSVIKSQLKQCVSYDYILEVISGGLFDEIIFVSCATHARGLSFLTSGLVRVVQCLSLQSVRLRQKLCWLHGTCHMPDDVHTFIVG
jgi:hypothetical protein